MDIFGKVPPQATDAERAILGAILIQSDAILEVSNIISADSFYLPEHKLIFEAAYNLATKLKPIDIITVSRELKNVGKLDEVGGEMFLSELTDRVATSAHIEFHARIVQQKYIARQLIKSAAEIQRRAFDESEDASDLIEFAESEVFNISDAGAKKEVSELKTLIAKSVEKLEDRAKSEKHVIGVPTGYTDIDRITGGFQAPDLIILAARPAMGKTAFALNICRNMAIEFNIPVAVFSLEMSEAQLSDRLLIAESGVIGDNYKTGKLSGKEWDAIEQTSARLEKGKIYIDDTPAISIWELRSKARKLVRVGVQFIAVDYLQLMTAGKEYKGNREGEISAISRNLKNIAKELNVPILALSQLNRGVESRADKRPILSDLRESGAIEQDADMVVFIHRPEYYGIETDEQESTRGLAEIIIAKYRNGATGKVKMKFESEIIKFSDWNAVKIENNYAPEVHDIPFNDKFDDESPF